LYQLGLRTGYYRRKTSGDTLQTDLPAQSYNFRPVVRLPSRAKLIKILDRDGKAQLLAEADEILAGKVRLFGAAPAPLQLTPSGPLEHWTRWEGGIAENDHEINDIKFIWEAGRFGWAYTLGRAYILTGEDLYADAFWAYVETFLDANPPYMGPHWASAQEAALRLVAFVFAMQVFENAPATTQERIKRLGQAVAKHANRIPPTLVYARAQNNNHLLSEAVGLYTAGCALPYHPEALRWRELGWHWFNQGVQSQFSEDGAYMQHSANYHRLALQLALWMRLLVCGRGQNFPPQTEKCLAAAARWLLTLLDPHNGCTPNLGANDGAYILPLTVCPFNDYRPVLGAAGLAFLGESNFEPGVWDEMAAWLAPAGQRDEPVLSSSVHPQDSPLVLRSPDGDNWAYLRAARFNDRPGHADQLHLDLWWRGLNLAQDAGTYLYNAPSPWTNALTHTGVHNTITINGEEQMTPAGRFLYLNWAQAQVLAHDVDDDDFRERLVVQHNGYHRLGVIHQRSVSLKKDESWVIEDTLIPVKSLASRNSPVAVALNWLLPDWPWEVVEDDDKITVRVRSPFGWVGLDLYGDQNAGLPKLQIVRAGELVFGVGKISETWGWSSPTYGDKMPALALRYSLNAAPPFILKSEWLFPSE